MIILGLIMAGLAVVVYCACAVGAYDPHEFHD